MIINNKGCYKVVKKLAVDVGFGCVKALYNKDKRIVFPSVVGDFRPVRYWSSVDTDESLSQLCIEYCGRRYYVGEIAHLQAKARVTMDASRFTSIEGIALLLTALMHLSPDRHSVLKLATGLPVNEFASEKNAYKKALIGEHFLKLLSPNGHIIRDNHIVISEAIVLPQPMGSIFNAVLNEDGSDNGSPLAGGRIGVIDIGRNTVDLIQTDKMIFIDRSSTSFDDIGLDDAYRELSVELKNNFGVSIPSESIEPYVRKDTIQYRGKGQSISIEKEKVYRAQAEKIASRVKNTWKDIWQINSIIVTGGGAIVLGDYIAEFLGEEDQITVYKNSEATFTNVMGYLKFYERVSKNV